HPDRTNGDREKEERFKEINKAYQVLSNPFEKAKHDLELKYGNLYDPVETVYSPPPPSATHHTSEPEIDWKENWIATAYAFAFTFILAALVMTAIQIHSYLNSIEMEALL